MPAGLVLLTPEVDLTESGDSFITLADVSVGLQSLLDVNCALRGRARPHRPIPLPALRRRDRVPTDAADLGHPRPVPVEHGSHAPQAARVRGRCRPAHLRRPPPRRLRQRPGRGRRIRRSRSLRPEVPPQGLMTCPTRGPRLARWGFPGCAHQIGVRPHELAHLSLQRLDALRVARLRSRALSRVDRGLFAACRRPPRNAARPGPPPHSATVPDPPSGSLQQAASHAHEAPADTSSVLA